MQRPRVFVPLVLGAWAAGGCGASAPDVPADRKVAFSLELPHGALDPTGFSTVKVVVHEPGKKDVELTASIADDAFDLGTIEPVAGVSIEATLRNDSGAAVGYGRIDGAAFADGGTITIPVRRPIAYIAGAVSRDPDGNANTAELAWTEAPATFSDLSTGKTPDGTTELTDNTPMMISAGASLYMITQGIDDLTGALTGDAQVAPVSTADHTAGVPLAGMMTGSVIDGAGTDDGKYLVIGTTSQLFAVATQAGSAAMLAPGSFSRVAILTTDAGEVVALAIKNRGSTTGTCASTAELWWAPIAPAGNVHLLATGGFSDVATDRGQGYYVDACKRELGAVTASGIMTLRSTTAASSTAEPTVLAVSNGQAYIGLEDPPATTSLLVASLASQDPPRILWTENAQQVVEATALVGVQRELDATSAVLGQIEVGAGGDYVALTTNAHFHGVEVPPANFPEIEIDTEELRVFDASTGGAVQRYRSWCDGVITLQGGNGRSSYIDSWRCASASGQSAPAPDNPKTNATYDHHISSMTFLYGKK